MKGDLSISGYFEGWQLSEVVKSIVLMQETDPPSLVY